MQFTVMSHNLSFQVNVVVGHVDVVSLIQRLSDGRYIISTGDTVHIFTNLVCNLLEGTLIGEGVICLRVAIGTLVLDSQFISLYSSQRRFLS